MIKIKICGIICEYNPLHKGHIYQIQKAKEIIKPDYIVCIMSGNFVQRGENAVFDKFARTKAVLNSGADAVVELPTIYSLQSAEYFAFGGVQIADNIGCSHLCFGSESGDIDVLSEKDKISLKWAINNNINIISQSYVETSKDILNVREYIKTINGNLKDIKIFSKIETQLALRNYKEIISCSDGIIIARGDLVPECGLITSVEEEFDLLRNLKSSNYNRDIIIATHILDSMKNGFSSTISELESIYTFINSGVTGFLLAGETSVGKKPVETVKLLKQLIRAYEKKLPLNCGQT